MFLTSVLKFCVEKIHCASPWHGILSSIADEVIERLAHIAEIPHDVPPSNGSPENVVLLWLALQSA